MLILRPVPKHLDGTVNNIVNNIYRADYEQCGAPPPWRQRNPNKCTDRNRTANKKRVQDKRDLEFSQDR
jgi:hypothetical protein